MAISLKLKLHLHFRPKPFYTHTTRFCSSSSSSSSSPFPKPQNDTVKPQNDTETQNRFSTFEYIKNHLKQPKQQQSFAPRVNNPKGAASVEEIHKNLSEFRLRSAAPPPTKPQISFQELYKKNAEANKETDRSRSTLSMDSIRQSLQKMRETAPKSNREGNFHPMSLSSFKSSFKLGPESGNKGRAIGEELPSEVFGKEMNEEKEVSGAMKTELLRTYNYEELGEKLRTLRPDGVDKKKEGWFSLTELNERLVKLREIEEIEERQMQSRQPGGVKLYSILRNSLGQIKDPDDRPNMMGVQRLDIWNELSDTPDYMKHPPKEQLVEKYFHPDNMSASEKLKIELTKVREDFKMSESDCGSPRVQVAQLTTKIKYLSKTLHKKDKHSRKGLIAMVQQRKKLLKYLRRTDWESYCLLLDKLGLRDNPDIKMLAA